MSIMLTGMVGKLIRTVTDTAIEQSFRIIYDSSTTRGYRSFPIVPFRTYESPRFHKRDQPPPPRKTIRTNVPNHPPAVALRCQDI